MIEHEGILGIAAAKMATGDGRDMNAYETQPSDFVLSELLPKSGAETHRNVFVAFDPAETLSAVISCRPLGSALSSSCNHYFRACKIDVRMNYPREYLPQWNDLQSSVSDFNSCALDH